MYLQFHSVKEPSKNRDIWDLVRFVLAGFGFFPISTLVFRLALQRSV